MKRRLSTVIVLAAASMTLGTETLARQNPQTASIQGTIVRAGTAEPLAGARVTYFRQSSPGVSVTTDARGAFAITDIEPGTYVLAFSARGYETRDYRQKTPHGHGEPLELAAGQVVKDLVVQLTPGGSVEGRVRDSEGFPAIGVPVQLMRLVYFQGKRTLSAEAVAGSCPVIAEGFPRPTIAFG
jgi:hypothetical protein